MMKLKARIKFSKTEIFNSNTSLVFREMVNFSNTINYLATQMNYETSFKQHNKERFIIDAGVKE